jgi:hypothetical protein
MASPRALRLRVDTLLSSERRDTQHAEIGNLAVDPRAVLNAQVAIIAVLSIASTVAGTALYFSGWPAESFGYRTVKLFWLDTERNIPTFYQCASMLGASTLFALLGRRCRRAAETSMAVSWFTLAFVFVFLAIDEGVGIHETIGALYGTSYGASWSFYYIPVVLVLGAWLLPFLRRLPRKTRNRLVLSGLLFVGGSVGVEMVGQAYAEAYSKTTPIYAALATKEEVLEMLGVALLIFALLKELADPRVAIRR